MNVFMNRILPKNINVRNLLSIAGYALLLSGCTIVGRASNPAAYVSTNLIDGVSVSGETSRLGLANYYDSLSRCEAYVSAVENGSKNAENRRAAVGIISIALGGATSITGALSAIFAGNASSINNKTVPEETGDARKDAAANADRATGLAITTAVLGALTAGVVAYDNLIGPSKSSEEFTAARVRLSNAIQAGESQVDKFVEAKAKNEVSIQNLVAARQALSFCGAMVTELDIDTESVNGYVAYAQSRRVGAVNALLLETSNNPKPKRGVNPETKPAAVNPETKPVTDGG